MWWRVTQVLQWIVEFQYVDMLIWWYVDKLIFWYSWYVDMLLCWWASLVCWYADIASILTCWCNRMRVLFWQVVSCMVIPYWRCWHTLYADMFAYIVLHLLLLCLYLDVMIRWCIVTSRCVHMLHRLAGTLVSSAYIVCVYSLVYPDDQVTRHRQTRLLYFFDFFVNFLRWWCWWSGSSSFRDTISEAPYDVGVSCDFQLGLRLPVRVATSS